MIRNIVFDLGRVLVDFDPEGYLRDMGFSPEETKDYLTKIFYSRDWSLHDEGFYPTTDALAAALIQKYPADEAAIRRILRPEWVDMHVVRPDVVEYLRSFKRAGFRVFILSNLAADPYASFSDYAFLQEVDGGVFSFMERVCKPDRRIYRILLDRYGLKPEETVFFDDNTNNIKVANEIGIHGILFTDLPSAKAEYVKLLDK